MEAIPHGGILVNRVVPASRREQMEDRARSLKRVTLTSREISDLEMIGVGALSPLEGFMGRADYESVMERMSLDNGLPWTIPITLAVTAEEADRLEEGEELCLTDAQGEILGLMTLEEKHPHQKEREAIEIYGTQDTSHPGVAYLQSVKDVLLGGKAIVVARQKHADFHEYRLDPADTRRLFHERGWTRVVGFQTRNPIHRAHEYIQKCALEVVDGLLVHPLVGETKSDDIPADVRMRCYKVLLENYYPAQRTMLAVMPAAMRYAGPREAIFHAIIRKNYGCTHFIVGRDHAGVGNFYDSFAAHQIFDEFDAADLGIIPMFFNHTFFCRLCNSMASYKTCPHDSSHYVTLSGTKVREMLRNGIIPPVEFTRPEVAKILMEAM